MAVTVENIKQLHIIAGKVLSEHGGNIGKALPNFLYATADAGLGLDPDDAGPMLPAIEYAAREYLTAFAKGTNQ